MLLLSDSFHTLSQDEKALIDTRRFHHTLFVILGPTVIFRSSQIDCRCRTYLGLFGGGDSDLNSKDRMGTRRVGVKLEVKAC